MRLLLDKLKCSLPVLDEDLAIPYVHGLPCHSITDASVSCFTDFVIPSVCAHALLAYVLFLALRRG